MPKSLLGGLEHVLTRIKSKEYVTPWDVRTMFKEYANAIVSMTPDEQDEFKEDLTTTAKDALKKIKEKERTTEEISMYHAIIDNFDHTNMTAEEKASMKNGLSEAYKRPFKLGGGRRSKRSRRSRRSRRFRRSRK